jgi:hypothetical protein
VAGSNCNLCDWKAADVPIRDIAGCLATWHFYEEHPAAWRAIAGNRPPSDPDPRTDEGMAEIISEYLAKPGALWS